MQLHILVLLCIASVGVLGVDTRRRSTPLLKRSRRPLPPKHPKASGRVDELWITQPLDQFDPSNTDTWQQVSFRFIQEVSDIALFCCYIVTFEEVIKRI